MRRTVMLLLALVCSVVSAQQVTHEVDLSWNKIVGADGYRVSWGTVSRLTTAPTNSVSFLLSDTRLDCTEPTTCKVTVAGLPQDTALFFSAQAFNAAGNGGFSREVQSWPEPTVTALPTDCDPVVGGGATCVTHIQGFDMAPGIVVTIPYPGVTILSTNRLNSNNVDLSFTITASAQGGNADLVMRNPWSVTAGTEIPTDTAPTGGVAGDTFQGALSITPIVLPDAPFNFQRIER